MSRSDRLQRALIPILDMLQTLPAFVYLIPLIFLFSVTEPKLYGIAIILYAIVGNTSHRPGYQTCRCRSH